MTKFKAGMLFLCGAMGASFATFFFADGGWEWCVAGIGFALAGIALPSRGAWLDAQLLICRLIFGLTGSATGFSIVLAIHDLSKESHLPTVTWFVIAVIALCASWTVEE